MDKGRFENLAIGLALMFMHFSQFIKVEPKLIFGFFFDPSQFWLLFVLTVDHLYQSHQ